MSTSLFIFLVSIISVIAFIYLIYLILKSGEFSTKPKKQLQISAKNILEQSNILFGQKKYKLVIKIAEKYLETEPDYVELRELLAKTYFAEDHIYEAVKECLIILGKEEHNIEIRLLLAKCYKKLNQHAKAVNELKEVLDREPENVVAVKNLSDIYLESNQKVSAVKLLKKLEELTDNNLEIMQIKTQLADIQIELENYPEAFDELRGILEIYPEDVETNKKLIELYLKVQNYDGAIENCERLLEVNDNNSFSLWLLNNLVNLYFIQKDIDKTMDYAKMLLDHPFSDKVKTRTYIAKILIASGKEEEGLNLLNELSEVNSENIEIKRLLINTYMNKNKFVEAIELYKEILNLVNPLDVKEVHTEMSNLFVRWAKYLFSNEDINECFKIFTLAVQYDNTNPNVYYELGQVNAEIKNYNEAILQLKKAISINPSNAEYHLAIADCFEAIGNVFEQKDALNEAIAVDDSNTEALYKLAMLYEEQHDRLKEISTLERILEIQPNHIDAKYQLALILESQGNKDEALRLYREIESVNFEYKNVRETIEMLTSNENSN